MPNGGWTIGDRMPITPNADQFAELVAGSDTKTGEVVMLNLLKYKASATDGEGGSGEASYGRYAAQAIRMVEAQGGRVLWMGRPDQVLIGDTTADSWDAVALVSYPSRKHFLDMVSKPEYQDAHVHRDGGLERTVLLAMTPRDQVGP
jgi:uncharacterized protein (DUF1330 family)